MRKKEEVLELLTAFEEDTYSNKEALAETERFEQQLFSIIATDKVSARKTQLIISYFDDNFKKGRISSEENYQYIVQCLKSIEKKIQIEKAGVHGEREIEFQLNAIARSNKRLKNISLCVDGIHTECDYIVITSSALFIIEVKNTKHTPIIDENGDYYTQSESKGTQFNKNILEQLNNQCVSIEKILADKGFANIPIIKTLVFANNSLNVQNSCKYIEVCSKSVLPHWINDYHSDYVISENNIEVVCQIIRESERIEKYPIDFDFDIIKFKNIVAETIEEIEQNEMSEFENVDQSAKIEEKTPVSEPSGLKKLINSVKKSFSWKNVIRFSMPGVGDGIVFVVESIQGMKE